MTKLSRIEFFGTLSSESSFTGVLLLVLSVTSLTLLVVGSILYTTSVFALILKIVWVLLVEFNYLEFVIQTNVLSDSLCLYIPL